MCVLATYGAVRFEGKVPRWPKESVTCVLKHAGDAERISIDTGQAAGLLFRAMKAAELQAVSPENRLSHMLASASIDNTDRNYACSLAKLSRISWYQGA